MGKSDRSSKRIKIADETEDSSGKKLGLAECRDMDRQLARVASTKFGDVHSGVLEEIFQNKFFSDLLGIRR